MPVRRLLAVEEDIVGRPLGDRAEGLQVPERADVPLIANEQLIVELYSK